MPDPPLIPFEMKRQEGAPVSVPAARAGVSHVRSGVSENVVVHVADPPEHAHVAAVALSSTRKHTNPMEPVRFASSTPPPPVGEGSVVSLNVVVPLLLPPPKTDASPHSYSVSDPTN